MDSALRVRNQRFEDIPLLVSQVTMPHESLMREPALATSLDPLVAFG
jgi:hypothetical protein